MKTRLERMKNIVENVAEMNEAYEVMMDSVLMFTKEPLGATKKEIKQQKLLFDRSKNKLMGKIRDFWCKYE